MRLLHFFIIILSLLGLFGVYIFFYEPIDNAPAFSISSISNAVLESEPFSPAKERERWSQRIDEIGAERAYQELKHEYNQKIVDQHNAAHLFGDTLYEKAGPKGIKVCDDAFLYGCFHGVVINIIMDKGLDAIPHLDCATGSPGFTGQCFHGVGHGLIEYLGTKKDNIIAALTTCDSLSSLKGFVGPCQAGVFHEYFEGAAFLAKVEHQPRPFNPDQPYGICPVLPNKFRTICYREITMVWVNHVSLDQLVELCNAISKIEEREGCYEGAGTIMAPHTSYNSTEIITKCKKIPYTRGEILCRHGAFRAFWGRLEDKTIAPLVCEGLNEAEKDQCIGLGDLEGV